MFAQEAASPEVDFLCVLGELGGKKFLTLFGFWNYMNRRVSR
jgi:hypothetical protein